MQGGLVRAIVEVSCLPHCTVKRKCACQALLGYSIVPKHRINGGEMLSYFFLLGQFVNAVTLKGVRGRDSAEDLKGCPLCKCGRHIVSEV